MLLRADLFAPLQFGRIARRPGELRDAGQQPIVDRPHAPGHGRHHGVIIVPSVSDNDAKTMFPNGWKTVRSYLRVVPQPK